MSGYIPEDFVDEDLEWNFLEKIPSIRIDPIKLIFRVWDKALGKGKYRKRADLKRLLLTYKEKKMGTLHGPLFRNLDKDTNIDTIRKKMYRKSKTKDFYDELTNYIYKKSFIEKVTPFFDGKKLWE